MIQTITGFACAAIAATDVVARYLPVSNHIGVFATALFPFISLLSLPAVLLFVAARQRTLAVLAAAVLVIALTVRLPHPDPTDAGSSTRIRLLTVNLYLGRADLAAVAASALTDADVLAVQELTPVAAQQLSARIGATFRYKVIDARDYAGGVGLWSRIPIANQRLIPRFQMAMVSADLQIDTHYRPTTLIVAHMSGPWPQPIDDWRRDMARLDITMQETRRRAGAGAVLVLGDFNSTTDMLPFRRLLRDGYQDAPAQAGVPSPPTYPANSWMPPIIAIDHVLTYHCVARSVSTRAFPGTDHRGLAVTVDIPATRMDGA